MKKIIFLFLLLSFAAVNLSSAQTHVLFGTCYDGGSSNWGTIFQANLDGSNLHIVYSFQDIEGAMPCGAQAQTANGKVYGVTILGGCSDSCTLYEYDPITNTCFDVYDFACNPPYSGEPSYGGLILLPDGNLYGLQQNGIIYKFNPNTHVYTMLQQTAGAGYNGGLMQASDGKLYGVEMSGGTYNSGYIFSFDLASSAYSILHDFDSIHGASPSMVSLIQATDGKLYGTTRWGGDNTNGVIFSYDILSNTYTDLHHFDGPNGSHPTCGLIQASNGMLYGVTSEGGNTNYGVIFSYDISVSQYSVLHYFDGSSGSEPICALTQASNGKLFGTTYTGGTNNGGVAFSYDITSNTYTNLGAFNTTGWYPTCVILEATLEPTGITSAAASPVSFYVDAANQLVVRSPEFEDINELVIYDGQGKKVFQSESVNQKSEFDLSSYGRGIYFVQLKSESKVSTQKIVLSK